MLLVSNNITKERHLCVERFATSSLPKCRNAETSNMFPNKHNHCIAWEGICCSFLFHQSSILAKQNSIISDDCAHLSYYSISKSPTRMSPRKWTSTHHLRNQRSYIEQSSLLYPHQRSTRNNMRTILWTMCNKSDGYFDGYSHWQGPQMYRYAYEYVYFLEYGQRLRQIRSWSNR